MDLAKGFCIEALGSGKHVKSAPVYVRFDQSVHDGWDSLGINAKRARRADQGHVPAFYAERRRDAHRNLGLHAYPLGGPDSPNRFALALDAYRCAGDNSGFELHVELAGTGEVHRNAVETGLLQVSQ